LLMFSCCLSSTVFVSLYNRFEYFHKEQQNTHQLYKSFELEILIFLMTCHGKNGELSYAMSC
jgi:hypothetical protein